MLYDDNGISIDGEVRGWFRDDTAARFRAYGWNVIAGVDGHDAAALDAALHAARTQSAHPTLILCRTHIGFGSPGKVDTAEAHGAPLGADEVARTRERLQWTAAPFEIPAAVARGVGRARRGRAAAGRVERAASPRTPPRTRRDAAEFRRRIGERAAGGLGRDPGGAGRRGSRRRDAGRDAQGLAAGAGDPDRARARARRRLGRPHRVEPHRHQGDDRRSSRESATGNYLHYGVREFGMAALMNGMALHGGLLPYGGTFLVFSDYARNAIRMAALMRQRVVYVFTHDSIGLGEDGPTHQPVEHAASLRLIPGLDVWRPADAYETALAWAAAIERRDGPTALLLSRQNLAQGPRIDAGDVARGGYVLAEADQGPARAVIIATGSEVQLALQARERLQQAGLPVRVVSMPCTSAFERQDAAYRSRVLPAGVPRSPSRPAIRRPGGATSGGEGRVVGIDALRRVGAGAGAVRALRHHRRRGRRRGARDPRRR